MQRHVAAHSASITRLLISTICCCHHAHALLKQDATEWNAANMFGSDHSTMTEGLMRSTGARHVNWILDTGLQATCCMYAVCTPAIPFCVLCFSV